MADALDRDRAAREYAVDPAVNVALEASAGTGKTRVLVDRYVNLIRIGVEPRRILALTFTRKAAAEMRARIVAELSRLAEIGQMPPEVWSALRGRLAEVAIGTIDAFCLSLLGEFPLEADVDPGFGVADETETPRLVDEALDRALRAGRAHSADNRELGALFARLGEGRLRTALAGVLDRRLVAVAALDRFLAHAGAGLTTHIVAERAAARIRTLVPVDTLTRLIATGPATDDFRLLAALLTRTVQPQGLPEAGAVADLLDRMRDYFCTRSGAARRRPLHMKAAFPTAHAYATHAGLVAEIGAHVPVLVTAHRLDVNALMARGLRWLVARSLEQYRRTLDEHAMVDFPDALARALALLERMEEFSQSRYRLESRYQHVLVDELQDTSRPQWALVELLVRAWGEGLGLAHEGPAPPSIFVVGDRKQSIYGFRDAEVGVIDDAVALVGRLRQGRDGRRAIVRSFRAVPALQLFVNDVCGEVDKRADRTDAFRYEDADRFPVGDAESVPVAAPEGIEPAVGLVAGPDSATCARAVAGEIRRLLDAEATVRDRVSGVRRAIAPGDVAILFRSRDSHREFERELAAVNVPFYVYKGLGFFDADEVKDVLALLAYLAEPDSDRCAAAFLRSRLVRLSDPGLTALAPRVAWALRSADPPPLDALTGEDRQVLLLIRASVGRWLTLADRLPPAELVDLVLAESAYDAETRGPGQAQARENLKKLRGLLRRIQNRGYATLARVSARLDQLMAGDESNAIVDAADAVNLMTVHAAKGLEFPVVFVVNLSRGTGGHQAPVEVVTRRSPAGTVEDLVSIDGLAADTGVEIEAREREEAKRLLYVALTRARDRLYLATALSREGTFAPAPTALGQVLPPALGAVLARAGVPGDATVEWRAASGVTHVCQVVRADDVRVRTAGHEMSGPPAQDDFAPLTFAHEARRPASSPAASEAQTAIGRPGGRGRRAPAWLMTEADVLYEVPLSWRTDDGGTIRAVVDALVRHADGSVTVVEFAAGTARGVAARPLQLCVEGVQRLLPGTAVHGRVVHLDA